MKGGGGGGGGGGGKGKGGGNRRGGGGGGGSCTICGRTGHASRNCPDNPARGGGAVTAPGGATASGSVKRDERRTEEAEARDRKKKQDEEREQEALKAQRAQERKVKAAAEEKRKAEEEQQKVEEAARVRAEEEARKVREAEESARRRERKRVLRQQNLDPKPPGRDFFKSLNSKAQKCATFPKKLSGLTRENAAAITKEFEGLNLSRYVAELVTHVVEAPLRNTDVFAMVEMCSAIHQRYAPDFAEALIPALVAQFEACDPSKVSAETEQVAAVTKRRTALRLLTELFICGVATDLTVLQNCVSDLIKRDPLRKNGTVYNLMMLLSFVRRASGPILGIERAGASEGPEAAAAAEEESERVESSEVLLEPDKAKRFHTVFTKYFDGVCEYLTEEFHKMKRAERYNREQLRTKGVISDKGKEQYEERRAVFEKLLQHVQQFAEALSRDVPKLIEEKIETIESIGTEVMAAQSQLSETEQNALWPDEEIRSFYEDLQDLSGKVPGMLLGLEKKDKEAAAAAAAAEAPGQEPAPADAAVAAAPEASEEPAPLSAADEAAMEAAGAEVEDAPKPKTPLDVFMLSLNECFSRRKADDAAEEFANNFGDKKGRNRLAEVLFNCPRTKLELIPRFCRIVATLDQYPMFKEVAPQLVKRLESQFFYLLKKKNQLTLEGKLRNARFLGELVNFKLCPADLAFRMLGKLLDEFVHHNVDVAVMMLEVCGRFLYRSPATHVRMRVLLERMLRIKETGGLGDRSAAAVDNAYFHCNPPDTPAIARKERTPLQRFVRHVLFQDLDRASRGTVLEHLRRLPWREPGVCEYVTKCFLKLSRGKFGSIPHLAALVAALAPAHEMFVIRVVDGVVEQQRLCLEDRHRYGAATDPQLQVMNTRFLGELFLCDVVDSRLVFDVLYTTLFLGVADPCRTEDTFRVHLVVTLVDAVAKSLAKGTGAKRLEVFAQYLQRYVLALHHVTMDLHFALSDCLERLPVRVPRFHSLAEAAAAIRKLEGVPEVDHERLRRDAERAKQERDAAQTEAERRVALEEKRRLAAEERRKRDEEERRQFDRDLAALMSERPAPAAAAAATAAGAAQRKGLKMGIPVALLQQRDAELEVTEDGEAKPKPVAAVAAPAAAAAEEDFDSNDGEDSDEGEDDEDEDAPATAPDPEFDRRAAVAPFKGVTFKVLLRKGAKLQARELQIPDDSVIALKVKERQSNEEREREEMRGLVLQKAKLVAQDDELQGSVRLNRAGMGSGGNSGGGGGGGVAGSGSGGAPTRVLRRF